MARMLHHFVGEASQRTRERGGGALSGAWIAAGVIVQAESEGSATSTRGKSRRWLVHGQEEGRKEEGHEEEGCEEEEV